MKKVITIIFKVIVIVIILLLITWRIDRTFFNPYIPNFNDQIRNDVTTLKFSVPKDKVSCEEIGGIWKKMGPRPFEECNIPTKDAGKVCSESKICEGVCLADLTYDQIKDGMKGKKIKTLGKCSSVIKVMGCRAYVYQGWAQVVCAD
jgi:hypothetical protein